MSNSIGQAYQLSLWDALRRDGQEINSLKAL